MKAMRLIWLMAVLVGLAGMTAYAAPSPWDQPASALAGQIAAILGPGQTRLSIRNLSSISTSEIPGIQRLLEQGLKAHGVTIAGTESANSVEVTLSESSRERLMVAAIVEGNRTEVAIVDLGPIQPQHSSSTEALTLRSQKIFSAHEQVLALLEANGSLVVVEPQRLVLYRKSGDGWNEMKHFDFIQERALARDPRGIIIPIEIAGVSGFRAFSGAMKCTGNFGTTDQQAEWPVSCAESDDPWPIAQEPETLSSATQQPAAFLSLGFRSVSAFYNASRDYFAGVVTPSPGVDLPPFYSASLIPRGADLTALLVGGIDGKVRLVENNALKLVTGTRDWGSDFAALSNGCAAGAQIIASGSGEAVSDDLRAYELPALEALPVSSPLTMDGTVTALWPAPDSKSVLAVIKNPANEYEVDRVTALCN